MNPMHFPSCPTPPFIANDGQTQWANQGRKTQIYWPYLFLFDIWACEPKLLNSLVHLDMVVPHGHIFFFFSHTMRLHARYRIGALHFSLKAFQQRLKYCQKTNNLHLGNISIPKKLHLPVLLQPNKIFRDYRCYHRTSPNAFWTCAPNLTAPKKFSKFRKSTVQTHLLWRPLNTMPPCSPP